jgi:hypothetical protein
MHRRDSDLFYVMDLPLENLCGIAKWNSCSLDATSPDRFHVTTARSGCKQRGTGNDYESEFRTCVLGEDGVAGAVDP